jgi:hypothetical protein
MNNPVQATELIMKCHQRERTGVRNSTLLGIRTISARYV